MAIPSPIFPEELQRLAESLQEEGVIDLNVPVNRLLGLRGLREIERTLQEAEDGDTNHNWYVAGGSGYVIVCD